MTRGKLILVRHGESSGNLDTSALIDDRINFLTKYGVMQAQLCGHYLAASQMKFNKVTSSSLVRARHTMASILYEIGSQPWVVNPGFDELIAFDDRTRIEHAFQRLMADWTEGNCLLVSHYGTIRVICGQLGVPVLDHVKHATPYEVTFQGGTAMREFDMSSTKNNRPGSAYQYVK